MNSSSNVPKNFKTITFPPSRTGQNAIAAPLPLPPPLKTIHSAEADRRAQQLKDMKKFVGEQRCPLCGGQLDGTIGYERAILYCVIGTEKEYRVSFSFGLDKPCRSISTYYTTHFAYEIDNIHMADELYLNKMYKIDLSLNIRNQQLLKKEILAYEGKILLLDKNLNEEDLLSKIKLYTLFS